MNFTDADIYSLCEDVKKRLGEKRFLHTKGVAKCAGRLAQLCEIESKIEAEIAGYLHDITKEYTFEKQLALINECNIKLDNEDLESPAVFHSFTAPEMIKLDFPKFATEKILSAVRLHTLGSPDMTEFDEIIFLADFIEETRIYPSSVKLREYVFSNMKEGQPKENIRILHLAVISAIDSTIRHLKENNKYINPKNVLTKNALLSKI